MFSKEEYQECLETLLRFAHESPNVKWALIHERIRLENLIETYPEYLELKAKATPFKPLNQRYDNIRDIGGGDCKCNSMVYESHMFCTECGQAIDWGKE